MGDPQKSLNSEEQGQVGRCDGWHAPEGEAEREKSKEEGWRQRVRLFYEEEW